MILRVFLPGVLTLHVDGGGDGDESVSGDAAGGNGNGHGPGGNAYTGNSGPSRGGTIYNSAGSVDNSNNSSEPPVPSRVCGQS